MNNTFALSVILLSWGLLVTGSLEEDMMFTRKNTTATRTYSTVEQEVIKTVAFSSLDCGRQCASHRMCTAFELEDNDARVAQSCYLLRSPLFSGKRSPPADVFEMVPHRVGCAWNQNGGVQRTVLRAGTPPDEYYSRTGFCKDAWIVLQSRGQCAELFNRTWADYKHGFGDPEVDMWLGLELMSDMTLAGDYRLRLELLNNDTWAHANYEEFYIKPENDFYRLNASNYTGSEDKDVLNWSFNSQNLKSVGANFSTYDRDNDANPDASCSVNTGSGWWHRKCTAAAINTPCPNQPGFSCTNKKNCILWYKLQWRAPPLKQTWMLMQPTM